MNKIIFAFSVLLAGCASQLTRNYDSTEFNYVVLIAADATHAVSRCGRRGDEYDAYLQKLNSNTFTLMEYVSNKSDTKQVLPEATMIREITQDFLANTDYSNRYCQHKLSNIQAGARMMARGLSGSDRFDLCKGGIRERFTFFELSYVQNQITRAEFANLSGDLIKMETIDASSCTLEERAALEKTINIIRTAVSFLL